LKKTTSHVMCCVLCIDLKKKKILGKRGMAQNFPKGQKEGFS
jgi:hypothetical protein